MGGVFKKTFEKIVLSLIPAEKDGTATLFPKKFEARLFEPEKQKAPDCVIKCRNDIVSGLKSPFFFAVRGWRKMGKEFIPSCRFIGNIATWVQKKHLFSCGIIP